MKKPIALTAVALLLATCVAPLRAATDSVNADKQNASGEQIDTNPKAVHTPKKAVPAKATTKKHATTQPVAAKGAAPAPKKHKGLFDDDALHKDRSLPAGDKVPVTDDKPVDPPYKHLNQDLHKDRG